VTQQSSASPHGGILEELRLEGEDAYGRIKDRALLRLLANLEAKRLGLEASQETKRETLNRMRAALGLLTRAELESWLARNHMDVATLERLIEEVAGGEVVTGTLGPFLDQHLLDQLRLTGDYERLEKRARRKDLLDAQGRGEATRGPLGQNAMALRIWYFERRMGRQLPDDIGAFVRQLGFSDLNEFDNALRREWLHNSENSH
jgi:hypothetical protein